MKEGAGRQGGKKEGQVPLLSCLELIGRGRGKVKTRGGERGGWKEKAREMSDRRRRRRGETETKGP